MGSRSRFVVKDNFYFSKISPAIEYFSKSNLPDIVKEHLFNRFLILETFDPINVYIP